MINLKTLLAAGFVVVSAMPAAVQAATITGSIGITGALASAPDLTLPDDTGIDVDFGNGFVVSSFGDFASIVPGTVVAMTDIDFSSPGQIWSVSGFTFLADLFTGFGSLPQGVGFTALGVISGNGFAATPGVLEFTSSGSTQTVTFSTATTVVPVPAALPLLLAGVGALAWTARRRKRTAV
jgi:hypothetical protein